MRRESEQQADEIEADLEYEDEALDAEFDVDRYEVPENDELDDIDEAGYFEDGDLYVEEPALPDEGEQEPPAERKPREPIELKLKAFSATLLAQARGIELPGAPDTTLRRIGTVATIVLVSLAVGAGAYLLGKGSGADVEQARLEGEAAGKQAGAIEGAAQGYAAGFKKGRETGFRKAYIPAYRLYYKRAYEQAGLDAPTNKQFDVPLP